MLAAVLMACLGVTWALYSEVGLVAPNPNAQSEEVQTSGDRPQAAAAADRLATDFTLSDLDGNQVSLSHFSGRPAVVNFWATWCGPCKAELPHLIEAYQRERGEVIFLAISVEEPRDIVRRFARENGMPFTILLDERGEVASDYRVKGIPTTFFISRDGEIVARYVGPIPPHRLEQGLDRIR
jgi:thiol-disulfide isomerase/thioredoxin